MVRASLNLSAWVVKSSSYFYGMFRQAVKPGSGTISAAYTSLWIPS